MNNSKIGDRLTGRLGLSKAAGRDAVDGVSEAIGEVVAEGDEVRFVGFGVSGTRHRPARTGHNSRTDESMEIKASTTPPFKLGKGLKDAVNGGSAS